MSEHSESADDRGTPPGVTVEFYGIPRERAGVDRARISVSGSGRALGEVLVEVAQRYPALEPDCVAAGELQPVCLANLNGREFLRDPTAVVRPGDNLLLMSADAGG